MGYTNDRALHIEACGDCADGYIDALGGFSCLEACSGCSSGNGDYNCPVRCKTDCPSYRFDGVVNCQTCKAGDAACRCPYWQVWNYTAGACGKHPG
jgi:hypothetical protein